MPQVTKKGLVKGNSGGNNVRQQKWPIMALQQLSDRRQRLQLDISLCRITGELGTAMKHAFEIGDRDLYEQLRAQRLQVTELRDRFLAEQLQRPADQS